MPFLRTHRPVPAILLALSLVFACLLRPAIPLRADDEPVNPDLPVIVINVASVQRLLDGAIATFESADRPELSETIGGALDKVNDLKGLSRDQSMGLMIYLSGIVPETVAYFPVSSMDELMKTIEIGPITPRRVGEDRIEIQTPDRTFYGKVVQDYVFVGTTAASIDRSFKDPTRFAARLARSYDIAASINFKSIIPATRDLFVNLLRSNTENNLQRRDREPETAYKIRRAAGMRNVELIEQVVTQGQELTIGMSLSPSERNLTFELVMTAAPGTEFAEYFQEIKGNRSRFAGLLTAEPALSASLAWQLDRSAKKMFTEMVSAVEIQLLKDLGEEALTEAVKGNGSNAVRNLAQVFRATIDTGRFDAIFQSVGEPGESFVLLGGVKVADGPTLREAVADILTRIKEKPVIASIRQDVFTHKGVGVHRIEFKPNREEDVNLYGSKPMLYVGVGDDALWLAFGGESAPAEIRRAIDKSTASVGEAIVSAPFQMVMNFSKWMNIFDPKKSEEGFAGRARSTFARGQDSLRLEALPMDDGLRLRLTLDEAFIRLLGLQISQQIDRNEEAREKAANAPARN